MTWDLICIHSMSNHGTAWGWGWGWGVGGGGGGVDTSITVIT